MHSPGLPPLRTPLLRAATLADAEAIQSIYAHHVLHGLASFETEPPTVADMRTRIERVLEAGYPYLVAVLNPSLDHDPNPSPLVDRGFDQGVLAYAYAGPFRSRPAYRYTVEDSIYVRPDATGRGLGRTLLERLIADCERRGYRQMLAVIGDSANVASIGVHRACGFSEPTILTGTGFKFGRWVDTVIMQRALGAGSRALPVD
jgi:phosphinothricin acetyltransferase